MLTIKIKKTNGRLNFRLRWPCVLKKPGIAVWHILQEALPGELLACNKYCLSGQEITGMLLSERVMNIQDDFVKDWVLYIASPTAASN